jgi:hypothetical protein
MGEVGAMLVIVLVLALIVWIANESGKGKEQTRQVFYRARFHVPSFLRSATGAGPWFQMIEFYRQMHVDIKCTKCEVDEIYVCNASGETEFIDLHFSGGVVKIQRGSVTLFSGNPLDLMSYPQEAYVLKENQPPPKESDVYGAYEEYMQGKQTGALDKYREPAKD